MKTLLNNGWVRLAIIAWLAWILWSLNQRDIANYGSECSSSSAIFCDTWDFLFPPILALGLWWTARGFGREKVEKALSHPKIPAAAALLIIAGLLALASNVVKLRQQLTDSVGDVASNVEDLKSTVDRIESDISR